MRPAGSQPLDPAARFPFRETPPKVSLEAEGRLIPILGILREQLHHDRGDRRGDPVGPFVRRRRRPGHVAVAPRHGVGGTEREFAREHLVQRDTARVEIASRIDRSIHPAGLFRRHVRERPRDDVGRFGRLPVTGPERRDAEARQPYVAGHDIDKDVRGLDVLMDEVVLVETRERIRKTDGHAEKH